MLVLTRKLNEAIVIDIDGGITITVVQLGRDSCQLGIDAPKETRILRGELTEPDGCQET